MRSLSDALTASRRADWLLYPLALLLLAACATARPEAHSLTLEHAAPAGATR